MNAAPDIIHDLRTGWSPSHAATMRDHLLECARNPVAEFGFDGGDIDALERLIAKAERAFKAALDVALVPF